MAGIYVHVPFCMDKCTYCDFASYPKEIGKAEVYFGCLYREIKERAAMLSGKSFDTVYIGGGTPSCVDAKYISGTMKRIRECFPLPNGAEITVEINPGTLDERKLDVYRAAGINRFSLGLQSADDGMLRRLNRIHTLDDYLRCARLLEGENFNADALIGLFGQTAADLERTLSVIIGSGASHISMYALRPEEGTPIYSDYLNGDLPDEDTVADLYDFGVDFMRNRGFLRYEVSNFARDGKRSRHNMNYWKRGEYIGFGAAAASHIDNRRFINTDVIDEYVSCILNGYFAEASSELVEGDEIRSEYIMLTLRTEDGIDAEDYKKTFGTPFEVQFRRELKNNADYLDLSGGRIRIKPQYMFVQNSIICDFLS